MKKIFFLTLLSFLFAKNIEDKPYVLMISFDGFRADYIDWYNTPNFDRLAKQGVKADGLKPVFVSKTFPNHYSLATGMYIENHGLVGNYFYDKKLDAYYTLSDRSKVEDGRFYGGEPIWVTAENQGIKTASYFWVGSEASIAGVRPSIWKKYDHNFSFTARIDSVSKWFALPEEIRPQLVMLYFHEPDDAGHRFGPKSAETEVMIDSMDSIMGRILDSMEKLDIYPNLNIIAVADHGMTAISPKRTINLEKYVNMDGMIQEGNGPFSLLYGKRSFTSWRLVKKLNKIPHLSAYLKKDIPERYHFKNHYRIKDILLVSDEGWSILGLTGRSANPEYHSGGTHGYDNELRSMHALFIADGPAFKDGFLSPRFENIHVYPLVVKILGLKPNPEIDGSLNSVKFLLREH